MLMKLCLVLSCVALTFEQRFDFPVQKQSMFSNVQQPGLPGSPSGRLGRLPPQLSRLPPPPLSSREDRLMRKPSGVTRGRMGPFRPPMGPFIPPMGNIPPMGPVRPPMGPFIPPMGNRPPMGPVRRPMGPIRPLMPMGPNTFPVGPGLYMKKETPFTPMSLPFPPSQNNLMPYQPQPDLLGMFGQSLYPELNQQSFHQSAQPQQQQRYRQSRNRNGFPDTNTLIMMKALNPEFAENGMIKTMICVHCRRQRSYLCMALYCMAET